SLFNENGLQRAYSEVHLRELRTMIVIVVCGHGGNLRDGEHVAKRAYSITSSARARSVGGMVRPSVFADTSRTGTGSRRCGESVQIAGSGAIGRACLRVRGSGLVLCCIGHCGTVSTLLQLGLVVRIYPCPFRFELRRNHPARIVAFDGLPAMSSL